MRWGVSRSNFSAHVHQPKDYVWKEKVMGLQTLANFFWNKEDEVPSSPPPSQSSDELYFFFGSFGIDRMNQKGIVVVDSWEQSLRRSARFA
mmetsp:Transcript_18210/g.15876  ORF Transcript_18210/g.15876 Transcript_18210/m.15876 type:complete len:91 (+) Transcript_18210:887-1159(+)